MQMTPALKRFIRDHAAEDTAKLLLASSRYPGIDVPFAVEQILARRQIRDKLPEWYANDDLVYPSRLAAEQCSSEPTARYKQRLLLGTACCDLTGGLGVDSYYFSRRPGTAVTYIERHPLYCEAARHNFAALRAPGIRILNTDARNLLRDLRTDTCYADPARRADSNRRVFALADCEPDILQLKPLLLENARRLIVKISPMADIGETLRLLPETREVHVISARNECKELLFLLEGDSPSPSAPLIHAIDLHPGTPDTLPFTFTLPEEKEAPLSTANAVGAYLYEPHAALLKSGAFKLTALRHDTPKLHRHSHLYTSDTLIADFPGRRFRVTDTFDFSGKLLKQLAARLPQANLTVRNFPLTVAELRARSRIREGGTLYLFATTLADERKILILTEKA